MIYELRTYTLKQGSVPDVVKAASTVSRDIRSDDYGKLEGYWVTRDRAAQPGDAPVELQRSQRAGAPARRARQEPALEQRVRAAHPSQPGAPGHPAAQRRACPGRAGQDAQRLRAALLSRQAGRRQAVAGPLHRRAAGAREILQDRRPMDAPRPASPTRSATSGRTPISTRARRSAPSSARTRAGSNSSRAAPACSTRCTRRSCCRRRTRR